jgi:hypothetical protein
MQFSTAESYFSKMASILPIIQEILPMVLPSSVSVTKAQDIWASDPPPSPIPPPRSLGEEDKERTTSRRNGTPPPRRNLLRPGVRVFHRNAVVGRSDAMCASGERSGDAHAVSRLSCQTTSLTRHLVLILKPGSCTTIRHYGEQGMYIYVINASSHYGFICT